MTDFLFGMTDTGKVSKNNEDVFLAEEIMEGRFILLGVIDGVGGYEGGEVAAALTREVVLSELSVIGTDIGAQLEVAFNLANEEILARKLGELQLLHMACVATVAVIDRQHNLFHYIHVGDTRLYLYRDSSLVKITHDQSPVGFLEDTGRITEVAAMEHPKRNQVNQALGLGTLENKTEGYFESGTSPFLPGDMLLLCSDGLTDLVDKASISTVLGNELSIQDKAQQLTDLANAAGGKDNITVVLARNDKPVVVYAPAHPIQEPTARREPVAIVPPVIVPAAMKDYEPEKLDHIFSKYTKTPLLLLSGLCLIFLASTLWLFFTNPPVKLKSDSVPNVKPLPSISIQERMLQDTVLKLKGDTLKLSATQYKGLIRLTRALTINRDTLIIKTDGNLTLKSDTSYHGAAIILSPVCKYVVLDGLTIENFDTGIVSYKNVMELKHLHFNNCKHALEVLFDFPQHSVVNGRVSKRAFLADTLIKN